MPEEKDLIVTIGLGGVENEEKQTNDTVIRNNSKNLGPHGQPINRNFSAKRLTNRTIDELIGLCKGIQADRILHDSEARFLAHWLNLSREIVDTWPANILASRIEKILEDNIIDDGERAELFNLLSEITGCRPEHELIDYSTGEIIENLSHASTLLPLDKPAPPIIFESMQFCLTGKFCYGARNKCEREITYRGGIPQSNVTQKTNYLVIGLLGSTDWKHSTHGLKIKAAIELKEKGSPVSIISEEHWVKHL
ncbi:MAG: BRCT domain-containing protein [Nitrospirae bacterium]|nr:BRCT domain-containing protein [Nitrospirota bacterium]